MPFKSARQRRFMYAKHPKIAARWSRKSHRKKKRTKRRRKRR